MERERPMTKEEMDQKIREMMEERARQDKEVREKYGVNFIPPPPSVSEKPLSKEEIDRKVQEMMQERARQDAEVRQKYGFGSSRK